MRRARRLVGQAAAEGAQLVAFPEAWLGGYPAWMFAMAGWDDPEGRDWYARFLQESLVVGDERFAELRQIAVDHGVTLVTGLNERAGAEAGSVYNSIATIGPDGALLNLHRKLTPTHTERIAWAAGDARGLRVVATPVGRVGGLVCWEHWHPLARQALHAQEEQIHVAVWPDQPEMHVLASRTYAFEGRCFVVSAATYLRLADVPEGCARRTTGVSGPSSTTRSYASTAGRR
ncbi:nitrilase-related carbon-nitrogen hydrolase [Pseudolysinimonas kribbensis]|nr:nitrilase-related carbon-nitrogen hydrolase [Pseudolysinimonas kribbensis]